MKIYVFGYGSLISPISASLTLGRVVNAADMLPAEIITYTRLWGCVIEVYLSNQERYIPINAAFLDIQEKSGSSANGFLIGISQSELEKMDIRERQYERIDVTDMVFPKLQKVLYIFILEGKSFP